MDLPIADPAPSGRGALPADLPNAQDRRTSTRDMEGSRAMSSMRPLGVEADDPGRIPGGMAQFFPGLHPLLPLERIGDDPPAPRSGDFLAHSSYRVTGIAAATGQEAGAAAAELPAVATRKMDGTRLRHPGLGQSRGRHVETSVTSETERRQRAFRANHGRARPSSRPATYRVHCPARMTLKYTRIPSALNEGWGWGFRHEEVASPGAGDCTSGRAWPVSMSARQTSQRRLARGALSHAARMPSGAGEPWLQPTASRPANPAGLHRVGIHHDVAVEYMP